MSAPTASTSTVTGVVPGVVPAGLVPYTEQSTTILLPDDNTAFLNPIQQFNRDLSVLGIKTFAQIYLGEKKAKVDRRRKHGGGTVGAAVWRLAGDNNNAK